VLKVQKNQKKSWKGQQGVEKEIKGGDGSPLKNNRMEASETGVQDLSEDGEGIKKR